MSQPSEHTPVARYGALRATVMPDGTIHSYYVRAPSEGTLWDRVPILGERMRTANDP